MGGYCNVCCAANLMRFVIIIGLMNLYVNLIPMKRILFFFLAFLMISIASFAIIRIIKSLNFKSRIVNQMTLLPSFEFLSTDSTLFTNDSLLESEAVIFIHFNTECFYCIYETEQLIEFSEHFKNVRILLVSDENLQKIKDYKAKYALEQYPFIEVLKDPDNLYYQYFGTGVIPSIIVYGKKGNLLKDFKGETKIETLFKLINEDNNLWSSKTSSHL